MIVYLITTTLLSIIGWALYVLLVREKYSWKQQKNFVLFTLLFSFLFPLIFYPKSSEILQPNPLVQPLAFGQRIEHHQLQSFCACPNPDYTHRIRYRTNGTLNFILEHKSYLNWAIGVAVSFVLLVFLLQMLYLRKLVRKSSKRKLFLGGKEVVLLVPPKPHSVGAFRLTKKYIIWQQELDKLSDEEQRAILLHENSHLNQRDTLLKALLRVAQCFWLLNPAFYYFRKELGLLSECIADEEGARALEGPLPYANLLVKVKQWQQAPMANFLKGSVLFKRIHRLTNRPQTKQIREYLLTSILLVLLQGGISIPVAKQVSNWFLALETYEEIYHKVETPDSEAIYCQDCETVCLPIN